MTLSQKESMLLQELISQEQLCIDKYKKHAAEASDAQLKNLFTEIGNIESQHLNTLNQIAGGTVPQMNSGSQNSGNSQKPTATYTAQSKDPNMQKDKFLCTDVLNTEKHVSSVYDTCIFEFKDQGVRDALNHIQKEEQQHGEKIYAYMSANGMY